MKNAGLIVLAYVLEEGFWYRSEGREAFRCAVAVSALTSKATVVGAFENGRAGLCQLVLLQSCFDCRADFKYRCVQV